MSTPTPPTPPVARHDPTKFELRCPKDGSPMQRVEVGGLTVDRCVACGAIWFDMGEVERVLKMKRSAATGLDVGAVKPSDAGKHGARQSVRKCPRDGEVLKGREYPDQSHIRVDECPFCKGLLMDAGELTDASNFTIGERLKSFFS